MTQPVTYARIPAFLRFAVTDPALSMGPVHGAYDALDRTLCARLRALPGQPITGAAATLDALEGTLVVSDDPDRAAGWAGFIERTTPGENTAGVRTADYRVVLDLTKADFADLLGLMQTGLPLGGLVLNFQDIDGPVEDDPLDRPIPWDDAAYPVVALTSFRLNWGA